MQPLSAGKRRAYFVLFVVLFIICLPIALLFAGGYRFSKGAGFVPTGGIFISVPYADATVSMNGKEIGVSRLLKREFYVGGLHPGSYVISVTRKGSLPWYRTLVVEEEIVSDAHALLIPEHITLVPISFQPTLSTSTRVLSRVQYDAYLKAFTIPAATSSVGSSGEALVVEDGDVFVRLVNADALPASNFCVQPSSCVREIPIEAGSQTVADAVYFGGGIVYTTEERGVFIAEADVRSTAVSAPLYSRPGADVRVIQGRLIVKDGTELYEIQGL